MTINERLVILVTQKSDEPSEGMTNFGRYLEKEYKKYYEVLVIDPKQIFKHNIDKKYHNNNIIIYALGPSFTSLIMLRIAKFKFKSLKTINIALLPVISNLGMRIIGMLMSKPDFTVCLSDTANKRFQSK